MSNLKLLPFIISCSIVGEGIFAAENAIKQVNRHTSKPAATAFSSETNSENQSNQLLTQSSRSKKAGKRNTRRHPQNKKNHVKAKNSAHIKGNDSNKSEAGPHNKGEIGISLGLPALIYPSLGGGFTYNFFSHVQLYLGFGSFTYTSEEFNIAYEVFLTRLHWLPNPNGEFYLYLGHTRRKGRIKDPEIAELIDETDESTEITIVWRNKFNQVYGSLGMGWQWPMGDWMTFDLSLGLDFLLSHSTSVKYDAFDRSVIDDEDLADKKAEQLDVVDGFIGSKVLPQVTLTFTGWIDLYD